MHPELDGLILVDGLLAADFLVLGVSLATLPPSLSICLSAPTSAAAK